MKAIAILYQMLTPKRPGQQAASDSAVSDQLVREGQERGEIRKPGDDCRTDLGERVPLRSPKDAAGVNDRSQLKPMYALAAADDGHLRARGRAGQRRRQPQPGQRRARFVREENAQRGDRVGISVTLRPELYWL